MTKASHAYAPEALGKLAQRLGFALPVPPLLIQALTHPAFFEGQKGQHKDNQRLEFLGDAVLDLLVGEYLFRTYPEAQEGELSKMRAYIVCEASLAAAARELGLDACLRLGRGSEASGDRQRPSVLADAYEAVVGAVFVTMGLDQAKEMILCQFGQKMEKLTPEDYEDKKSTLQELVQSRVPHGVTYHLLGQTGPDHQPRFSSAVYCGKLELGRGEGGSKKESEVAAAAAALRNKKQWLAQIVNTQ